MRLLVLYAHPAHDRSRANRALRTAVEDLPSLTLHDLYETYPDLFINVRREQALLLAHDVLVFQHPMYWYSAPAILKEWQDVVLEAGWAYGQGGNRLHGKYFMQALTTGGHAESYRRDGHARFTVAELLRPFEQMAYYCRMTYLPPFVTHAARLANDAEIATAATRYRALLADIASGSPPPPFTTVFSE